MLEEVSLISLGQAAGGNQHPTGSCFLQLAVGNDRIDRLLFGLFDKATGINNDHFGFLGVIRQGKPVRNQGAEHHLGIDLVFGTTEIHETDGGFLAV